MTKEEGLIGVMKMLERFGFAAVTLAAVLYVVRVDFVQPLVRSHDGFLKEIISHSHEQSEILRVQTEIIREIRQLVGTQTKAITAASARQTADSPYGG